MKYMGNVSSTTARNNKRRNYAVVVNRRNGAHLAVPQFRRQPKSPAGRQIAPHLNTYNEANRRERGERMPHNNGFDAIVKTLGAWRWTAEQSKGGRQRHAKKNPGT